MKKVLAILLTLVMALGIGSAFAETTEPLTIGYYGMSPTAAFSKEFYETLVAGAEAHGHELIGVFSDADAVKMRSAYEQFKMQGVDIIIDGNQIKDSMTPFVEQALADGIPYLACFVTYPDIPEAYTFGPNNIDMGTATGNYIGKIIAEEWNGELDMIILAGTFATAAAITERLTSAVPVVGEHVDISNVEELRIATTSGNAAAAYQMVMDALTANPGKKIAIFCQNDDIANASFAAVEAAGRAGDVVGVGSDCVDAALEYWQTAIKEENETAPWRGSIYLNTSSWGEVVMDLCENIVAGTQEEHVSIAPVVCAGLKNWEEFWPDLLERDFVQG